MKPDLDSRSNLLDEVKKALFLEWDPIGISEFPGAEDEYDLYAPDIVRLLIARRPENELFDYLWQLETDHMALPGNKTATRKFVGRLVEIYDES